MLPGNQTGTFLIRNSAGTLTNSSHVIIIIIFFYTPGSKETRG